MTNFRAILVGGTAIYLGATYLGYQHMVKKKRSELPEAPHTLEGVTEAKRDEIFSHLAPKYDKGVRFDEILFGINYLRWKLAGEAQGDLLEVAAGTGRNLPFYEYHQRANGRIKSVTLTDKSQSMIEQAQEKWDHINQGHFNSLSLLTARLLYQKAGTLPSSFFTSDIMGLEAHLQGKTFDTIIDTFGLCSFEDPQEALQELKKLCKPDGKILLLEHGMASASWLKTYQESKLPSHVHTWGCYFNRDIEQIARQAGLIIEEIKRYHFGSTYLIIARPAPAGG